VTTVGGETDDGGTAERDAGDDGVEGVEEGYVGRVPLQLEKSPVNLMNTGCALSIIFESKPT